MSKRRPRVRPTYVAPQAADARPACDECRQIQEALANPAMMTLDALFKAREWMTATPPIGTMVKARPRDGGPEILICPHHTPHTRLYGHRGKGKRAKLKVVERIVG